MNKKKCDFCGKPTERYIEGINSIVCHECIDIMNEDMEFEKAIRNDTNKNTLPKPHEIKAKLDEYIIGQDEAKKKIAVEIFSHYRRINFKKIEMPKNNILLLGSSGTGKTFMLEKLSEIIDVPVAFADATGFTKAGYTGKDVEVALRTLIQKANGDITKAERGIVFIDEIDKIARKSDRKESVDTEGVQQSLLTIMNGCDYVFDKKNAFDSVPTSINTRNILFILGGAFDGIDKIVNDRLSSGSTMGFGAIANTSKINPIEKITNEDLIKYGFIQEFVGRLPLMATLNKLTKEELLLILTSSKGSILKKYERLFRAEGIKLTFSDDALEYIADEALKKNTGARGLESSIANKMNTLMYELLMNDTSSIEITADMLKTDNQ